MTSAVTSGPPQHVEASELWTRLTSLPRPHTMVPFPRRHPETGQWLEDKVAIWVLTEADLMSCRASAELYAQDLLGSAKKKREADADGGLASGLGYQEIYRNAQVVEVLWRACRSPLNLQIPAFPSTLLIRKHFTSDECAALFQAYCTFQAESGPLLSMMSESEMNHWLEVLAEGASMVPLAALSLDQKHQLLKHSASLLHRSRPGNGSPGSPQDVSSTSSDPQHQSLAALRSASPKPAESSPLDPSERPVPPQRDE